MKTNIPLIAVLCTTSLLAFGGEIENIHRQQTQGTAFDFQKSRSRKEILSTNHGITEIGIERTMCYGNCPIYTFILKSDGTFRYKGVAVVPHIGQFFGTNYFAGFRPLAQFIHDSRYMELEETYSRGTTDLSTTYTMVVMNGQRKVVSNYGNAGPTKLWAIEQLIDDLISTIKWDEAQKTTDSKK